MSIIRFSMTPPPKNVLLPVICGKERFSGQKILFTF
jgi:hypothetical protein